MSFPVLFCLNQFFSISSHMSCFNRMRLLLKSGLQEGWFCFQGRVYMIDFSFRKRSLMYLATLLENKVRILISLSDSPEVPFRLNKSLQ